MPKTNKTSISWEVPHKSALKKLDSIKKQTIFLMKDIYFWYVTVMTLFAVLFSQAPRIISTLNLPLYGEWAFAYYVALYRGLFLMAVAIASWKYGTKGGMLLCILFSPFTLLVVIANREAFSFFIDISVLILGFIFSWLVGKQGTMNQLLSRNAEELKLQSEKLKTEIIERQQYEEALFLKSALLEAQCEAGIDGILAIDKQGEVILSNKRFEEMWDIPAQITKEKEYRPISSFMEGQVNEPQVLLRIYDCLIELSEGKSLAELHLKNGKIFEMYFSSLIDSIGIDRGHLLCFRDITERKMMDNRLVMIDRLSAVGEMVSGVAHEINNPMTSIIGFSQLLQEKVVDDDIKSKLIIINKEAQRAARIVRDLLTFSRKHVSQKQPGQINNVIDDVLALRSYEHNLLNIKVVKHLEPGLPLVIMDYSQIQQVFLNMVINAEYFMSDAHQKGRLVITSERTDDIVKIGFADDGPGITPENMKQIFDPFFTTKPVGKGTGLGLSICHGIVTEHGGKIYVESQPGKGANFIVEFPITSL
jgi:signal transduction histidine kinase